MRSHLGSPVDYGGSRTGRYTGTAATNGFASRLRRLLGCDRGVAAVEFGLAAPILLAALTPFRNGISFGRRFRPVRNTRQTTRGTRIRLPRSPAR